MGWAHLKATDLLALVLQGADRNDLLPPRDGLRLLPLEPPAAVARLLLVLGRHGPLGRQPSMALLETIRQCAELLRERLVLACELRARAVTHVGRVLEHQVQLVRVRLLRRLVHVDRLEVLAVRLLLRPDTLDHELIGLALVVGDVGGVLDLGELVLQPGHLRRVLVLVCIQVRCRHEAIPPLDKQRELLPHGSALGGEIVVAAAQLRRLLQDRISFTSHHESHDGATPRGRSSRAKEAAPETGPFEVTHTTPPR